MSSLRVRKFELTIANDRYGQIEKLFFSSGRLCRCIGKRQAKLQDSYHSVKRLRAHVSIRLTPRHSVSLHMQFSTIRPSIIPKHHHAPFLLAHPCSRSDQCTAQKWLSLALVRPHHYLTTHGVGKTPFDIKN